MKTAELLKRAQEDRKRLQILENHLGNSFYKTGELHNAISDAMREYASQFKQPIVEGEAVKQRIEWADKRLSLQGLGFHSTQIEMLEFAFHQTTLPLSGINMPSQSEAKKMFLKGNDEFNKGFESCYHWLHSQVTQINMQSKWSNILAQYNTHTENGNAGKNIIYSFYDWLERNYNAPIKRNESQITQSKQVEKKEDEVVLPTEQEIQLKLASGQTLSSLERFISNHQPRDEQEAETFRTQLQNIFR